MLACCTKQIIEKKRNKETRKQDVQERKEGRGRGGTGGMNS